MTKTIVVVNRHRVAANRKNGTRDPVLRVTSGKYGRPRYVSSVTLRGSVTVVSDPDNPLPCGATCWVEIEEDTTAPEERHCPWPIPGT